MQDSDVSQLKIRFASAIVLVAATIVLLFFSSYAISLLLAKFGYPNYYNFVPGQYIGYRIGQLDRYEPSNTCLILGASTAREGLDVDRLSREIPNTNFVTIATTGNFAISPIDIQSRIVSSKNEKFKCIILGMHSFLIGQLRDDSYDLTSTDYISQLQPIDIVDLTRYNMTADGIVSLFKALLLPAGKHVEIMRKHLYFYVHKAHAYLMNNPRPRGSFEHYPGELVVAKSHYLYDGIESDFEAAQKSAPAFLKENKFFEKSLYTGLVPRRIFAESIETLLANSERLIVMSLPASSVYDEGVELANGSFFSVLESYSSQIEFLSCRIPPAEQPEYFHDAIHVNEKGRWRLTNELVSYFGGTATPDRWCSSVTF